MYEIVVSAKDNPTELMTVPKKNEPNVQIALKIHNYTIEKVEVTKHELDKSSGMWSVTKSWDNLQKSDDYYPIACKDSSTTFTNEYTPYTSSGSWTPKATKVVEGGEMKEFTLQLATDKEFTKNVQNKSTKTDAGKSQTLSFDEIKYELKTSKNSRPTPRVAVRAKPFLITFANSGRPRRLRTTSTTSRSIDLMSQ